MVLNINMPQFVEQNDAATGFSALNVHERFFRHWPEADSPTTIFFCEPSDNYGSFCEWYEAVFEGPSDHLCCKNFDLCEVCQRSRKTFTSVGHYTEYHKAVFFGDKEMANRILAAGNSSPYVGSNNVEVRKNSVLRFSDCIKGFHQSTWDQVKCDVRLQANLWKFGVEADCRTAGYDFIEVGVPLRDQLLSTESRSLVESRLNDDQWAQIARNQRGWRDENEQEERRKCFEDQLAQIQDDSRFHDEDEKDFWGENYWGQLMMDVRSRVRGGTKPRQWIEFKSIHD